jgi:4a-hydroxytetrahydrobiopterin dehydratase
VQACEADGHLRVDLRAERVILTLQSSAHASVTTCDAEMAHQISAAVREIGLRTEPANTQLLEIAIDTRAPAFWVLADAEGNEACVTTWQGRE